MLLIAIEARFIAEHPLPFLTSYVAGSRVKVAPIWFGAALFVSLGPVEDRVARPGAAPASTIVLLAVLGALWAVLAWIGHRKGAPREDDLDLFQAQLDEATQLKL